MNTIEDNQNTYDEYLQKYSLVKILKNYNVSTIFATKYLLNEKYAKSEEDKNITIQDITFFQSHINEEELTNMFLNINKTN